MTSVSVAGSTPAGHARRSSGSSSRSQDEALDPRIYIALEQLNKASTDINLCEMALDAARAAFRRLLNESSQQLDSLSKKLGSCIEKARPYYEARKRAKEAQVSTQSAAQRFEFACGQLEAAKEMVNLAEQGYFKHGQPFDPAWQEMLNHSTFRVSSAERERLALEVEHRLTAQVSQEAEQLVKKLQKDCKRSINKSRPYFELKAQVNLQMEERKQEVLSLEARFTAAKTCYADTLHGLEQLSDDIRARRRESRLARRAGRARGRGGALLYHPLMDSTESIPDEDDVFEAEPPTTGAVQGGLEGAAATRSDVSIEQLETPLRRASWAAIATAQTAGAVPGQRVAASAQLAAADLAQSCAVLTVRCTAPSTSLDPTPPFTDQSTPAPPLGPPAPPSGPPQAGPPRRSLLRPTGSREDMLSDGGSETESVTSSFAGSGGGVGGESGAGGAGLGDEQIESLMVETGDYRRFLDTMDAGESARFRRLSLPAKLGYLRDLVGFEPIWVDDDVPPHSPSDSDAGGSEGAEEDTGRVSVMEKGKRVEGHVGVMVGGHDGVRAGDDEVTAGDHDGIRVGGHDRVRTGSQDAVKAVRCQNDVRVAANQSGSGAATMNQNTIEIWRDEGQVRVGCEPEGNGAETGCLCGHGACEVSDPLEVHKVLHSCTGSRDGLV